LIGPNNPIFVIFISQRLHHLNLSIVDTISLTDIRVRYERLFFINNLILIHQVFVVKLLFNLFIIFFIKLIFKNFVQNFILFVFILAHLQNLLVHLLLLNLRLVWNIILRGFLLIKMFWIIVGWFYGIVSVLFFW